MEGDAQKSDLLHNKFKLPNLHPFSCFALSTNIQNYNPDDITIWINQTSSSFPFGCTALHNYITGSDTISLKYQDYLYDMFNWATPTNAFKWRFTEATPGVLDFSKPDEAIIVLRSRG